MNHITNYGVETNEYCMNYDNPSSATVDRYGNKVPGTYMYCAEAPGSPTNVTSNRDSPGTSTRLLKVVGAGNRTDAQKLVNGWIRLNSMQYDYGVPLKSKSLSREAGSDVWSCTLEYSGAKEEKWIDEVSITTMGGSAHIDTSYETLSSNVLLSGYSVENTFHKISINEEGEPEGCDVKRPTLQINVTLNWGWSVVGYDFLNNLMSLTNCVNSNTWFGCPAGTLIFNGANIDRVNYSDVFDNTVMYRWKVQYQFEAMPNVTYVEQILNPSTGLPAGTASIRKRGWDFLWSKYRKCMIDGEAKTLKQQVNVERVYDYVDFNLIGIPDDLFSLGESIDNSGDTNW